MYNYRQYLIYLFGSLAISIGLQLVLPFPYGLAVALALFMVFPFVYRRIILQKNTGLGRFGGLEGQKLSMICSICGKKSKERECPRCGGRQFKIG